MLIERLGPVLNRLRLLAPAFRLYQRFSGLDLRLYTKNRKFRSSLDGLPIPPAHLLTTVAGSADVYAFLDGGKLAFETIRFMLNQQGLTLEGLRSVLDFGCGCGRVLRHWKSVRNVELYGVDYNPELTKWCVSNLPFAQIKTNGLLPPADYTGQTFDLIYALSVFTHLPEAAQHAWMQEFRRLLRPGGMLLLTLHGSHYVPRLSETERAAFENGKLVTRYANTAGTNLCSVFHPGDWVRDHLTAGFEIAAFSPEGARGNPRQDAWLFRRLPD